MLRHFRYIFLVFICQQLSAQSFLNGDFENNTAGVCQLNLPNSNFNTYMPNCTAFGVGNEIDIQDAACTYGTPNSGNWFLSLATSIIGHNDELSLELDAPLMAGNSYHFCYFDQANTMFSLYDSIEIGLSNSPTSFGTLIYSSQPVDAVWTKRSVSFTAPINGNFITVRNQGTNRGWNFIDNFTFNCCAPLDLGKDTSICSGLNLTLDATTPNASYLWQDNSTFPTYTATQTGTYWVEVTLSTCSTTDTINVTTNGCEVILDMPNVFTPNANGANDHFHPIRMSGIDHATLMIYNRWGQKMAETNDLLTGWDGRYNSMYCPEGIYYWVISYSSASAGSKTLKGFLSLLK